MAKKTFEAEVNFNPHRITLFFIILKTLHKFELKNLTAKISVPMVIAFRKSIIFESFVFKY